MRVLAFGIVKEFLGGSPLEITVPDDTTVKTLKELLAQDYPALGQLSSFMIAVNGEYAKNDTLLKPGDEVAIIPPVSGG